MKLEKYLRDMCINRNEFCKKVGVTYVSITNVMKGIGDIHLATAIRIEDVTEGKVTCRDLVNPTSLKNLEFKSEYMRKEKEKKLKQKKSEQELEKQAVSA